MNWPMMEVPVNEIISSLMSLGFMVTMNQRLDAETLQIIVEDFGYEVDFTKQVKSLGMKRS